MRDVSFQGKPQRITWGIIGSLILPLVYLVALVRSRDPKFIVSTLGPPGVIVGAVQRVAFRIGGSVLAVIAAALLFSFVGCIVGALAGWVADTVVKIRDHH